MEICLPPNMNSITSSIYGFLEIKIGEIRFLNGKLNKGIYYLRTKFWGEEHDGHLLITENTDN